jgi:superfamily II DNA or RNA helicase
VLVGQKDLQAQWVERLGQYLPGATVGTVGGGRPETSGRVVVGMMQTLANFAPDRLVSWGSSFGLVVVDELHHAPAETWSWVLGHLPGRYRLGLTATPSRADGLWSWAEMSVGPVVAKVEQAELQACGAVLVPEVRRVTTGWDLPAGLDGKRWDQIMARLCGDSARNEGIRLLVASEVAEGRVVLVLTGRVPHAVQLAEMCGGVHLVSGTAARDRKQRLEAVRAGSVRVLVATSLADEGLDLPQVDTVVLAYPEKDSTKVEQRVGRALRPAPGKVARVVDLRDEWKPLQGWSKKRDSLYKKKGW